MATDDAQPPVAAPEPSNEVGSGLGARIHEIRLRRAMTLRAVAAKAQISPSLLSQIERGTARPSLVSLVAIADALVVRPGELLDYSADSSPADPVVRRADRRVIDDPACRREYLMHRDDPYLEVAELLLAPGGASRPSLAAHSGRDYGVVLEGSVCVERVSGRDRLEQGDYIAFDAQEPHRIVNDSDQPARILWMIAHDARSARGVEAREQ